VEAVAPVEEKVEAPVEAAPVEEVKADAPANVDDV
jgi:hypothetical protein